MIQSIDPRSGINPVTGDSIQPTTAGEGASVINGHEYSNPQRSDLQYSCIFPLLTPRDCSTGTETACDCDDASNDNPLCVSNPADNNNPTLQKYGKAYPGTRLLQVLKGVGNRAVVGSVCPAQLADDQTADFAYRPFTNSVVESLDPLLTSLP